jgi:hypothetical protein
MKTTALAFMVLLILLPAAGIAGQSDDGSRHVRIELVKENEFVVKVMKAIDASGKKIPQLAGLDTFNIEEKAFIFKNSKSKIQKIPADKVGEVAIILLRQGVLTGKPQSYRVIAWNGEMRTFAVAFRDFRIKNGALFLKQDMLSKHFNDTDMLRTNSQEWSDRLYIFWAKVEKDSPEVFAANFAFKDGRGAMTRKIAEDYCRTCVSLEVLGMQVNTANETVMIRCKYVFYDRWDE